MALPSTRRSSPGLLTSSYNNLSCAKTQCRPRQQGRKLQQQRSHAPSSISRNTSARPLEGSLHVGRSNGYSESECTSQVLSPLDVSSRSYLVSFFSCRCYPVSCLIRLCAGRIKGMYADIRCGGGPAIEVTNALDASSKSEDVPRVSQSFM